MRTNVAQLKASAIPKILGMCSDDPRVLDYANEAMQRLMQRKEKWTGVLVEYAFCTNDNCLTLPRQIETVEAATICDGPVAIRNGWYEYLRNGPGQSGCGCDLGIRDRIGSFCTFNDILGVNKKLKVYADVAESATAKILLQGYDENGNWIRTLVGSEWVDGEYVLIATAGTLSTKLFSSITGIQKPTTNGAVCLYEYNTDLTTQRAMGIYEPDETIPQYRRIKIPGLSNLSSGEDCSTKNISIIAKLRFIPVSKDTDYLPIGNLPAIKDMIQSIRKMENNLFTEAKQWEASALMTLDNELASHLGDGAKPLITFAGAAQFGLPIENLI